MFRFTRSFYTDQKRYHILIVSIALALPVFYYGDANIPARKLVDHIYLLITGKPLAYVIEKDFAGIPIVNERSTGVHRNPVSVCNAALDYETNADDDPKALQYFFNCANWLVDHRTMQNDSTSVLEYQYDWAPCNMTAPWRSGMAQGLSLQVLIKAHQRSSDDRYLVAARQQLNSFLIEVNDNGVTYKSDSDGWWYEEFADKDGKETRILNGMMFAVLGIYDYYQYTQLSLAKSLYQQGVLALKKHVAEYDRSGLSYYDKIGTVASLKYHRIHVDLLAKLYQQTNEQEFKIYLTKWAEYKDPNFVQRLIRGELKPIYIAVYGTNAILLFVAFEIILAFVYIMRKLI